jgi:hypothetical protein
MSDNESKFQFPIVRKLGDHVDFLIKFLIAIFPYGGSVKQFYEYLVQPPLNKEQQIWFNHIGQILENILKRIENIEYKISDENFIALVVQATSIAENTNKEEKREALMNVVINSAITKNIENKKQQLFLRLLEHFNEYHILFLKFLDDPKEYLAFKKINLNDLNGNGESIVFTTLVYIICLVFPDFNDEEEFCNVIISNLYDEKLINVQNGKVNTKPEFLLKKLTTELGSQFLKFITES